MAFLLIILIVGLTILWSEVRTLSRRVEALEDRLKADERAQADALAVAAPAAEPRPSWTRAEPEIAPRPRRDAHLLLGEPSHAPAAEPAAGTEAADGDGVAGMFERFVGGRLLIWVGGIALAVAGLLLVRYSIEIGLVTPPVRMAMAFGFGLLLVGAGEAARRRPGLSPDPRVPQALVGAGILVLYAAAYGSHVLYGLIDLATCGVLMAAITAAALGLALRHGAPAAVMGLAGGFATPLLVGDPDAGAIPLIAYLALLDIALFALAYRRSWSWFAAMALLLSFGWTFALIAAPEASDALAGGLFAVALAIAGSWLQPGGGRHLRLVQPAGIALVQVAALIARADIDAVGWLLYGALAAASLVLTARGREYRLLGPFALALALFLLGAEGASGFDPLLPWIAAAITLMFGAAGWAGREPRLLWTAIGAVGLAGPALVLRAGEPGLLVPAGWGLMLAGLAALPALLAARQARHASAETVDMPLAVAASAAALLLMVGTADLVPFDALGAAWAAVALVALAAARQLGDRGLAYLGLTIGGVALVVAVSAVPELWNAIGRSIGGAPALASTLPDLGDAALALALPALLFAAGWRLLPAAFAEPRRGLLIVAGALAAAAAYVAFKQVFALESRADFAARGFAERMVLTQALFAAGWLLLAGKVRLPVETAVAARIGAVLTGIAAARLVWFDLMLHNPALVTQHVGPWPILNLVTPAFLGAATWLWAARARGAAQPVPHLWLTLFLAALVGGAMLLVRQAFQGSDLSGSGMPRGEFYCYSLVGLVLAAALLAAGVRREDKGLRVAGLALLTATAFKVFLVDAAALEGVLRILSFLGLGIALIGIGKLYGAILKAERRG